MNDLYINFFKWNKDYKIFYESCRKHLNLKLSSLFARISSAIKMSGLKLMTVEKTNLVVMPLENFLIGVSLNFDNSAKSKIS